MNTRQPVVASFSFQHEAPGQTVSVDIVKSVALFREKVEKFGSDEAYARHILEVSKSNNTEAVRAIDSAKFSNWASDFWQTKDWFWELREIVPGLILELTKYAPATKPLQKAFEFFGKRSTRWVPKTMNPLEEIPSKYLLVLKDLRVFLAAVQKAAAATTTSKAIPVKVGRFEMYDGVGASETDVKNAQRVLHEAASLMGTLGLDEFCYGKVTLVSASSFSRGAAAFYAVDTDELFISPNIGVQDTRVFCHELAHRVYFKWNLRNEAQHLYAMVKDRGVWVTEYAKTDASENFAEMVSFAAIGKLTEEAKSLLQATTRKIRVASRYSANVGRFI